MIKFLVFLVLFYVGYRALKNWLSGGSSQSLGRTPEVVDDEMVKDPVCGIYVARRSGVPLVQDGREMIFCSEECRDRYLQEQQDAGE
ncbi:MAG: hypothetical protein ACOWWM_01290 [Desulfobacterales bacterium]